MLTHRLQGYSSRRLVKAEENLIEYKQQMLLETILTEAVHSHPDSHFNLVGTYKIKG